MLTGHRETNADDAWEMEVVVLGQAAAGVKATLRELNRGGHRSKVTPWWKEPEIPQDVQICFQVQLEATGRFN